MPSKRNKTTLEPKMITVLTNWGRHIQVPVESIKKFAQDHPEEYIHYEGPVPEKIISTPKPIFTIGALAAIRQARKTGTSPDLGGGGGEINYV
jgi:hypothetical protein